MRNSTQKGFASIFAIAVMGLVAAIGSAISFIHPNKEAAASTSIPVIQEGAAASEEIKPIEPTESQTVPKTVKPSAAVPKLQVTVAPAVSTTTATTASLVPAPVETIVQATTTQKISKEEYETQMTAIAAGLESLNEKMTNLGHEISQEIKAVNPAKTSTSTVAYLVQIKSLYCDPSSLPASTASKIQELKNMKGQQWELFKKRSDLWIDYGVCHLISGDSYWCDGFNMTYPEDKDSYVAMCENSHT